MINEIWNKRSLILTLAISDLRLRYRNSALGFFWSFLEPLLLLTVLYLVFTNIFKANIEHYPLFLLMGLIMWNMFSRGTSSAMESILNKAGLVSQTSLPREVVIISSVFTAFLMMVFELIVFFIFMVFFNVLPSLTSLFLPVFLVLLFVFTLGLSLILAGLFVYYRDLRSIWGVVLQAGFFLTTVIYNIDIFPKDLRPLIFINPLISLLDNSRAVTIYGHLPQNEGFVYFILVAFSSLVVGFLIFKKLDKRIIEEL